MFAPISLDNTPAWKIIPLGTVLFLLVIALHVLIYVGLAAIIGHSFPYAIGLIPAGVALFFSTFVVFQIIADKYFNAQTKRTGLLLCAGQFIVGAVGIGLLISHNPF